MDVETVMHAFAAAGDDLPREAMLWARDNWEVAAPAFLERLQAYADGTDRSKATATALFFIAHLMAEKAETRAFGPLCRSARDDAAMREALGATIGETFRGILIRTFDGDVGALKALIESEEADELARSEAFDVLAYLTAVGKIDGGATEAYLRHLVDALRPREESIVWDAWAAAVALLGLESFVPTVRDLMARGLIPAWCMTAKDFDTLLRRTLDDPARMAGFASEHIHPFDDAIVELSSWHSFTEEAREEREQAEEWRAAHPTMASQLHAPAEPYVNPHRGVGRNDPCPCGSGKKYKKCCLAEQVVRA